VHEFGHGPHGFRRQQRINTGNGGTRCDRERGGIAPGAEHVKGPETGGVLREWHVNARARTGVVQVPVPDIPHHTDDFHPRILRVRRTAVVDTPPHRVFPGEKLARESLIDDRDGRGFRRVMRLE
jgi:hypothetical protein